MTTPASTSERFERFLRNITPSPTDLAGAHSRAWDVAKSLHNLFYSDPFTGSTMQLIGSIGKQTPVLPVGDADVLFKIPGSTWLQYYRHAGNGPSALLQRVRARLLETYPLSEIRGDGPVVKVLFKSGYWVEVVPGFKSSTSGYLVPRTVSGGSWPTADYDAELRSLQIADASSNGQARRLIKMLKTWKLASNVPIKSLAIELRVVSFLRTWEHRGKSTTYDDWMVRDFFSELIAKANSTANVPGTSEVCSYGDTWLPKARKAHTNAISACEWESKNDNTTACYVWREIFGEKFGY